MPSRNEIQEEITSAKGGAQDAVRRKYLAELSDHTKRDTIIMSSAFSSQKIENLPNFLVSITNEDIQGLMSALHGLKNNKLDIILHSPGGSIEAAEQIVKYLRNKYTNGKWAFYGSSSVNFGRIFASKGRNQKRSWHCANMGKAT
jgi:ClpP class serine protease